MPEPALAFSFGGFRLDTVRCTLSGPNGETTLSPIATRFLAELARTPGEIVERTALIAALWRDDPVVADAALNRLVSEVRQALGDDPRNPRLIQTVPRRGYRLVANAAPAPAPAPTLAERLNGTSYGKLAAVAGLIVLLTIAAKVLLDAAIPVFWAATR
ncbi:MAG: winged helix-turn-helix domain-containing protein [Hyphomonadaceae bacterium]|nr:winged helix-turn-helix domain-containing protein [Hyphomonadaceae bacterium]